MTTVTLRFVNPPEKPGRYTTVRRGEVHPLPVFGILGPAHEFVAKARLVSARTMKFWDVPEQDLRREHHPCCHNLTGLRAVLEQYYLGFRPDEMVTVIDFEIAPAPAGREEL